ncbi:calcium-binding protein [Marinibacterium profundimaris]|uniref:hypothetical protein n=1 Tax=Marinibacterium profundimaris TaxID=1679460 RepID=UPI000B523267|nr:hypothetical protein [Marinibacterium profundimaris]
MTTYSFDIIESWTWRSRSDFFGDGPEVSRGDELTAYTGRLYTRDDAPVTIEEGALAWDSGSWIDVASYGESPTYYAADRRSFTHEVFDLRWSGGTSTIYRVTYDYLIDDGSEFRSVGQYDSWALLDGAPLPVFRGPEDFRRFTDAARQSDPGPAFAEGAVVDLATLSGVTVSEADVIEDAFARTSEHFGGLGNDLFRAVADDSPDLFDGGPGLDTVDYRGAYGYAGSTINLADSRGNAGAAAQDSFVAVENAIGTSGDDLLVGTTGDNRLRGEAGDDRLIGLGGADILRGGAGNDLLVGGAGPDLLDGGTGWDRVSYARVETRLSIDMADPTASSGVAWGDRFVSVEMVIAGAGDDVLRGDAQANALRGGAGDDVLRGRAGDDALFGEDGRDLLIGEAGDDRLHGGADADTFRFNGGHDVILDLTPEDRIEISDRFARGASLTEDDLRDSATLIDGTLVLDFGPAHSLTLAGQAELEAILHLVSGY